ncbi:unnamed protein product [Caenorhabditis bovis]|uniref:Uncharacterized protein n=1 Tax=Caenorhabditis bovis TaxID=2654633 RepID=A0A8S1FFL3_9PELO|nr:unnamed protein product [Caenorhabditis bovis]
MEEIRAKMKSGANDLQTKMKDLSKGILTVSEEAKMRELEEKRRATTEKVNGAIGKAAEEKARWKASRDADAEREYARIEAEKHLRRKKIIIDKPLNDDEAKPEPKRTIRRWKPPPPDPNANIPSFSTGPKEFVKATPKTSGSKPTTPIAARRAVESATKTSTAAAGNEEVGATKGVKAEGAAATRIRNNATAAAAAAAASSATGAVPSEKSGSRRYSARRKTQEIVNESVVQPKTKRRKSASRKKRFVRNEKDIDVLLGIAQRITFEQLELMYEQASRNRRTIEETRRKIRRLMPSRVFISDLTDIDKIYKSSEIRDIIASVNLC